VVKLETETETEAMANNGGSVCYFGRKTNSRITKAIPRVPTVRLQIWTWELDKYDTKGS